MIVYTSPSGETALYAAGSNRDGVVILKTIDGLNWEALPAATGPGTTTRSIVIHQGRLYMAVLPANEIVNIQTLLFTSDDPEQNGWLPVALTGEADKNPRGNIVSMLSFNNHLYVGTGLPSGFELWRTSGPIPELNNWKIVVDQGAGDALNQFPGSLNVFGKYIYIGTASFAIRSLGPEQNLIPPKGFDLIRVTKEDQWELVVGGPPIAPTSPATGQRNKALSGFPSGFGNITNAYCWQIQGQGKNLFLGSFDWSVVVAELLPLLLEQNGDGLSAYDIPNLIKSIKKYLLFLILASKFSLVNSSINFPESEALTELLRPLIKIFENNLGFDMWKSSDGIHWLPVSFDGFDNRYNYSVRNLFLSANGDLYLGTANPFLGCQVWVKKTKKRSI